MLNTDVLIQKYFDQKNVLINHQIESYDFYIDEIIPQIIKQYFPVSIPFNDPECEIHKIELNVKNMHIGKPLLVENNGCSKLMTPNMARIRNSSYLSPIIVDFISTIHIKENDSIITLENKTIPNIIIGKVPIMVRSKYCILKSKENDEE